MMVMTRLRRMSATAEGTEETTLCESLPRSSGDAPGAAAAAASAAAASASTVQGGLVRVSHATRDSYRLPSVSGFGASAERQYQRTKRRGCAPRV